MRQRTIGITLGLGLLAAACAGSPPTPSSGAVTTDLREFSITMPSDAAAGQVTFRIRNSGTIPHEFVVVRTDLAPGALPVEGGMVSEGDLDIVGEHEDIAVGATSDLSLSLPAGHYVVICNIEGHYPGGMRAEITTR